MLAGSDLTSILGMIDEDVALLQLAIGGGTVRCGRLSLVSSETFGPRAKPGYSVSMSETEKKAIKIQMSE